METDWSMIDDVVVQTLGDERNNGVKLGDVLTSISAKNGNGTVVLSCLSHYGDYNACKFLLS
jgi:hypothetical protein